MVVSAPLSTDNQNSQNAHTHTHPYIYILNPSVNLLDEKWCIFLSCIFFSNYEFFSHGIILQVRYKISLKPTSSQHVETKK